jgi:hypothetical protein
LGAKREEVAGIRRNSSNDQIYNFYSPLDIPGVMMLRRMRYEEEPVNRSQMDIKHKAFDIRT